MLTVVQVDHVLGHVVMHLTMWGGGGAVGGAGLATWVGRQGGGGGGTGRAATIAASGGGQPVHASRHGTGPRSSEGQLGQGQLGQGGERERPGAVRSRGRAVRR